MNSGIIVRVDASESQLIAGRTVSFAAACGCEQADTSCPAHPFVWQDSLRVDGQPPFRSELVLALGRIDAPVHARFAFRNGRLNVTLVNAEAREALFSVYAAAQALCGRALHPQPLTRLFDPAAFGSDTLVVARDTLSSFGHVAKNCNVRGVLRVRVGVAVGTTESVAICVEAMQFIVVRRINL